MLSAKIKGKLNRFITPEKVRSAEKDAHTESSGAKISDAFPYDTLASCNEFRFLTLLPGAEDEEIECELSTQIIDFAAIAQQPDDNFSYEALSYTWGSIADLQNIKLNGHQKSVTKNLYSALRHLRNPKTPRVIWVDAVSVNQNDLQERSNQVVQMGQLYRHAKSVVAWIGESDPETDFCITLGNALFRVIRDEEEDEQLASIVRWVFGLDGRTRLEADTLEMHSVGLAWHGFDEMLNRSWFHRVWIVQEVVLASKVYIYCGKRWIDFELLYLAILKSSTFRETSELMVMGSSDGWTSFMGMGRVRGELRGPLNAYPELVHLLSRFNALDATDDRDRIYSFLGLTHSMADTTSTLAPGLIPDYSKPVHEVYFDFALYWMQSHKNLDIFSRIKNRNSKHQGKYHSKLPSWVPDWTQIDGFSASFIDIQSPEKLPYRASADEPAEVFYNPELEALQIKGFVVDTVSIVPPEPQWGKSLEDPRHQNWQIWTMITLGNPLSEQQYGVSGTTEAYWRTLVAGCDNEGGRAPDEWGKQIYDWLGLKVLLETESSNDDKEIRDIASATPPAKDEDLQDIVAAAANLGLSAEVDTSAARWRRVEGFKRQLLKTVGIRRIFVTEKGYIGIGPDDVRAGDRIAILSGGKMPYVLRKKEGIAFTIEPISGSETTDAKVLLVDCHELIDGGECYVHGLMDGEAMKTRSGREHEEASLLLV